MFDTLDFVYQEFKDLVKEIKDEKHLDEIKLIQQYQQIK